MIRSRTTRFLVTTRTSSKSGIESDPSAKGLDLAAVALAGGDPLGDIGVLDLARDRLLDRYVLDVLADPDPARLVRLGADLRPFLVANGLRDRLLARWGRAAVGVVHGHRPSGSS